MLQKALHCGHRGAVRAVMIEIDTAIRYAEHYSIYRNLTGGNPATASDDRSREAHAPRMRSLLDAVQGLPELGKAEAAPTAPAAMLCVVLKIQVPFIFILI
jgi:hypothetical protein